MHIGDIDFYKDFFHRLTGAQLDAEHSFILDSRLTPVAQKWNFPTLRAMTMALRGVPAPAMVDDIVNAMLPPETAFFRDPELFELIEKRALPFLARKRALRSLRVWSAGCATGEEALSLAMVVKDVCQTRKTRFRGIRILGTDINKDALAHAERGLFTQHAIQMLPAAMLTKYFIRRQDEWQVTRDIANMVRFEPFNLLHDMRSMGPFDLILCRNVLPAFDRATTARVLNELAGCLAPNGLLALGMGEVLPEGTALKPIENCPGFLTRADGPDRL